MSAKLQYGHVILASGYIVLRDVNWPYGNL